MEFIKLFVGPAFRKYEFVEMLSDCDINAAVVTDGIILDRAAFNRAKHLPQWAEVMKADINNPFKTREADLTEWPLRRIARFILAVPNEAGGWLLVLKSDNADELLELVGVIPGACVINTYTGEKM